MKQGTAGQILTDESYGIIMQKNSPNLETIMVADTATWKVVLGIAVCVVVRLATAHPDQLSG